MADQRDDAAIAAWLEHCARKWIQLLQGRLQRDAAQSRAELNQLIEEVRHG